MKRLTLPCNEIYNGYDSTRQVRADNGFRIAALERYIDCEFPYLFFQKIFSKQYVRYSLMIRRTLIFSVF